MSTEPELEAASVDEPEAVDVPGVSDASDVFEAPPMVQAKAAIPQGVQSIEPSWIACEQMSSRIFMLIFGLGTAGVVLVCFWLNLFGSSALIGMVVTWLVVVPTLAWLGYRWPVWEYPFRSWRLRDESFDVCTGLLVRRSIRVPRSRVQYTDVDDGPIRRRFGLATLKVHVAGTESATVVLEGIRRELADQLRDILIEGGGDDAV